MSVVQQSSPPEQIADGLILSLRLGAAHRSSPVYAVAGLLEAFESGAISALDLAAVRDSVSAWLDQAALDPVRQRIIAGFVDALFDGRLALLPAPLRANGQVRPRALRAGRVGPGVIDGG